MKTTRILIALALVATALALVPSASASPPTCEGNALINHVSCVEAFAGDVAQCVRQLKIYTVNGDPVIDWTCQEPGPL